MRPDKVFENSNERIFIERKGMALGPNPPSRVWIACGPAKTKGSCYLALTLKDAASDEVARAIVMSLEPAR
jgi:hypothetical protein